MTGTPRQIDQHIARLHGNGRLRVWSLIITFFGDAVALRGGRVALSTLQDAMGLLDIEAGAVRTALSRLASEGWVQREREGRLSFYKLTDQGSAAFDEPTKRIYAGAAPDWNGDWTVAIAAHDSTADLSSQGFVTLGGRAWLRVGSDAHRLPDGIMVITGKGSDLPAPLLSLWRLDDHAGHYETFIDNWQATNGSANLSTGDAMAARTLLIHDWRRIVLRDPALPDVLLPADWIGHNARKLARQIYQGLLQNSENWLNDNGLPAQTRPGLIEQRFNVLRNIAD